MDLHLLVKRVEKLVIDNSPTILTGIGVAGVISTVILTGRAAFESCHEIRDIEALRFHDDEDNFRLTFREKAELTWKNYIPPALTGVLTVVSIIGANRIGNRRAAAIAAAYSILEKGYEEYRAKVAEKIGEKKETAIRDEVIQDRVARDAPESREIVLIGSGQVLCRDDYSGRYFSSDVETIRRAANDINAQIINDSYASLTDFYELIGLSKTSISNEVGWTLDRMLDIKFSSALTEENKPVLSIQFRVDPVRNYQWLQ